MKEQFLLLDRIPAMSLDSLSTSHPVAVQLTDADEIVQQFDTISYSKGGSLLKMLEAYLDEQSIYLLIDSVNTYADGSYFTSGLNYYLTTHAYGYVSHQIIYSDTQRNAATSDLWSALEYKSGDDKIDQLMATWTLQKGTYCI